MPPRYHPADYPVFRQAVLSALFLVPLALGIWLVSGSEKEEQVARSGEAITIEPLPEPSKLTPLEISPDDIQAEAAVVYDLKTGTALFTKNENEIHSLASITKLMTALLVAELLDHNSAVITVTEEAVRQYGNSGLRVGERVTAENLNQYALLSSSNDAAYALAHSIGEELFDGEGSQAFVDAMNVRATELGLTETVFQNPTGLDVSTVESGALGTAEDVSKLMSFLVLEHSELLAPTKNIEQPIYNQDGEFHRAANTNPLVQNIPNLIGSKTGYTDLAGGNLVVALDVGFNRPIVVTVLNSSWTGRFQDVEFLIDSTIRHLQSNDFD